MAIMKLSQVNPDNFPQAEATLEAIRILGDARQNRHLLNVMREVDAQKQTEFYQHYSTRYEHEMMNRFTEFAVINARIFPATVQTIQQLHAKAGERSQNNSLLGDQLFREDCEFLMKSIRKIFPQMGTVNLPSTDFSYDLAKLITQLYWPLSLDTAKKKISREQLTQNMLADITLRGYYPDVAKSIIDLKKYDQTQITPYATKGERVSWLSQNLFENPRLKTVLSSQLQNGALASETLEKNA